MNTSPFHHKTFRQLFAAQVIALTGSGLTQVALALLAFDLSGIQAAWVLGIAWSMRVLASVIFAPLLAAWLHHLPRKHCLIALDIGRALLLLWLPWVSEVWQIYVLIFLLNILSAGFTPVFQALLPDVLPEEKTYTRALSHTRLAFELERLLSPALAGLALIFISYHALFVLNALSFTLSALFIFLAALPQTPIKKQESLRHNLTHGLTVYLHEPQLKALLGLHLAVAATGSMVIINTVAQVQGVLGFSETITSWMMGTAGLGAIIAARLTPWLLEKHLSDYQLFTRAGFLLAVILWPAVWLPADLPLMAILWFFIGLGSAFILTPVGRLLTRCSHENDRSLIFAANFSLSHAAWLLCYPVAGWFGSSHFADAALAMAVLAVCGSGFAYWQWTQYVHHSP